MYRGIRRAIYAVLFNSLIVLCILGCENYYGDEDEGKRINTEEPYFKTWRYYLGDPKRTHFSTLDNIDTTNVNDLKMAWRYESGGMRDKGNTQIQTNPLIVDNKLFGVNASNYLFAVNAKTGEHIWSFKPTEEGKKDTGGISRGFSYWRSENEKKDRIFYSSGHRLYAVDIDNGSLIKSFGSGGSVDLRKGLGRDPEKLPVVMTSPGAIYDDLLILGSSTVESPGAAPGDIRAYDVLTGEIEWTFHTIPRPGEFGYDTWPEQAYKTAGGANNWAGMSVDRGRGIVYVPTGSAAYDWYGGNRIGDNLFANTLLALDANTGERIWHYQTVHHDLWDRDLPAPPNLFTMVRDGKKIPAVAQVTKSGHVFVFNRLTGKPLFPIEEKEYPDTPLEGDETAETQPLPVKPAPFARQILKEENLYAPNQPAFIDAIVDKEENNKTVTVRQKFMDVTSKGQFVPPDTNGVIIFPGTDGGAEWGGAAVDPRNGVMYVNSNEMPWIVRMARVGQQDGKGLSRGASLAQIHCTRCHGGNLQGLDSAPGLQNVKNRLSRQKIESIIENGKGAMPAMPQLSSEEVSDIVGFLIEEEDVDTKENEKEQQDSKYADVPYVQVKFGRFKDNRGYPAVEPPWGTLNAIDLNTGEYLWRIPLGNEERLNDPDYPVTGIENYGGPIITAGGVLFIAATKDKKFRAFNMDTGKLLWETDLPAGGYATPSTYKIDGKQYVVIACGGGKMDTSSGDTYVSFSL